MQSLDFCTFQQVFSSQQSVRGALALAYVARRTNKLMNHSDVGPVVTGHITAATDALRSHTGEWIVTLICPYCQKQHVHAAPQGPGVDPGFRIAHCRLDRQGYFIVRSDTSPAGSDNS